MGEPKDNGFYVFEGDNGVGKTTLLNRVIQDIPGVKVHTPTEEFKIIRNYVHERNSTMGKFLYYVSSVFDSSIDIRENLNKSSVFCDRYIGSSIVDFLIRRDIKFEDVEGVYNFIKKDLIMPDCTFLLRCSHDERVRRVTQRGNASSAFDDISKNYSEKTNLFYDKLAERESNWHILDTTNCGVEKLASEVKEIIQNHVN